MTDKIYLAVNGTLMRGLKLNQNMLDVGAEFVREAKTEKAYRCWSIEDDHPGMIKCSGGGAQIDVEVWAVPPEGLASILLKEPAGLCVGKVKLDDETLVLGVLAEPWSIVDQKEITQYGGWRRYIENIG